MNCCSSRKPNLQKQSACYQSLSFLWTCGVIYYFTQKYTRQVEVKKMLVAADEDSRLSVVRRSRISLWRSWWICEEQAVMGRWEVTQKQLHELTKGRERIKKTAARWRADSVGWMRSVDVNSWCLHRWLRIRLTAGIKPVMLLLILSVPPDQADIILWPHQLRRFGHQPPSFAWSIIIKWERRKSPPEPKWVTTPWKRELILNQHS